MSSTFAVTYFNCLGSAKLTRNIESKTGPYCSMKEAQRVEVRLLQSRSYNIVTKFSKFLTTWASALCKIVAFTLHQFSFSLSSFSSLSTAVRTFLSHKDGAIQRIQILSRYLFSNRFCYYMLIEHRQFREIESLLITFSGAIFIVIINCLLTKIYCKSKKHFLS